FTQDGKDPLDTVEWSKRSAVIRNREGEVVFEQAGVEAPSSWSDMAVNVVVSRYFRGQLGTEERENSVRDLILRIVNTITEWGKEQEYFASEEDTQIFRDELIFIILHQMATFNSPVWFNVGIE